MFQYVSWYAKKSNSIKTGTEEHRYQTLEAIVLIAIQNMRVLDRINKITAIYTKIKAKI